MTETVTVYCPHCGSPEAVPVRAEAVRAIHSGGPTQTPRLHVVFQSTSVPHRCPDPTQDRVTQA